MQGQTTLVLASLVLVFSCLASAAGHVGGPVTSLQEVTSALVEVKRDNANLRRLLTEVQAALERRSLTACSHGNNTASQCPPSSSDGGATYIRWGRTSCPAESELMYEGYVGGGHHYQSGAAPNHLCLPRHPQYSTSAQPEHYANIYGTEYETFGLLVQHYDHDVPCAVCRSSTRSSAIMIPARTSCYPGLHREYYGYLMAGHPTHPSGSEYICVDHDPEDVEGGINSGTERFLYFTRGWCGSLKCPPYKNGWVIDCVVCSK